jgi:hypothetical protein
MKDAIESKHRQPMHFERQCEMGRFRGILPEFGRQESIVRLTAVVGISTLRCASTILVGHFWPISTNFLRWS